MIAIPGEPDLVLAFAMKRENKDYTGINLGRLSHTQDRERKEFKIRNNPQTDRQIGTDRRWKCRDGQKSESEGEIDG